MEGADGTFGRIRTLLDDCFRGTGRTTWNLEPAEFPQDLNHFLAYHNFERSHQGYRLNGGRALRASRALGNKDTPGNVPIE